MMVLVMSIFLQLTRRRTVVKRMWMPDMVIQFTVNCVRARDKSYPA